MKNTRKRLLGILFAAAMLFGVLTVSASAAETIHPAGDPLTYTVLKDGTVAVTDCESNQTSLTIPSTVEGKTVSKIAEDVCKNCSTLQSVTIGKSVKTIEQGAFSNCIKLSSITFESGSQLTTIETEAFAYLGKDAGVVPATIDTLTLPASLVTLEESAFHCIPVKHFALENGSKLTEIPDGFLSADGDDGQPGVGTERTGIWKWVNTAFEFVNLDAPFDYTPAAVAKACACLESIDLGDRNSLTRIGEGAFKNQICLTSIDFGENTRSSELTIGYGVFVAAGNNAGI